MYISVLLYGTSRLLFLLSFCQKSIQPYILPERDTQCIGQNPDELYNSIHSSYQTQNSNYRYTSNALFAPCNRSCNPEPDTTKFFNIWIRVLRLSSNMKTHLQSRNWLNQYGTNVLNVLNYGIPLMTTIIIR